MAVPSLSSIFRGGRHADSPAANKESSQNQIRHQQPPVPPPSSYVCEGDVCYMRRDSEEESNNSQSKKSNKGKQNKHSAVCFSMFPKRIRLRKVPTL
ncbi:hypothetical protein LINPERPRIM_LOCUS9020 [Linum perenne]